MATQVIKAYVEKQTPPAHEDGGDGKARWHGWHRRSVDTSLPIPMDDKDSASAGRTTSVLEASPKKPPLVAMLRQGCIHELASARRIVRCRGYAKS